MGICHGQCKEVKSQVLTVCSDDECGEEDSSSDIWYKQIECLAMNRKKKVNVSAAKIEKFMISHLVFPTDNRVSPLFASTTSSSVFNTSKSFLSRNVPVTQITPQVYFGTFEDAKNENNLRKIGVTHIISLIGPKHSIKNMKHRHYPMNDYGRTDLKLVIKKLQNFVEESQKVGNKLFVHCQSGQNRSATVVLAFLMKCEYMSLKDAYRKVKKKRPVVQINKQYAKQLSALEVELFDKSTMPSDWMEIRSVDMDKGKVVFSGEAVSAATLPEYSKTWTDVSDDSEIFISSNELSIEFIQ